MKSFFRGLALILTLCMLLSAGVFASGEPSGSAEPAASAEPAGSSEPAAAEAGSLAGTYTDGVNTLVIAEDGTFSMEKIGQNLEGAEFVLLVTGTVAADGTFTITGLYDGDIIHASIIKAQK